MRIVVNKKYKLIQVMGIFYTGIYPTLLLPVWYIYCYLPVSMNNEIVLLIIIHFWIDCSRAHVFSVKAQTTCYAYIYSKTCLKPSLKKKTKMGFQDWLSLNEGQKYSRMLKESILQYFRPSLSYHLSLRPLFCLILGGRLRQVKL